jgi:uncharacterized phage protein (TIGR01671 family)
MREIKFRAWDCSPDTIRATTGARGIMFYEDEVTAHDDVWNIGHWEGNALTQFTGLKDKNGKEIYEGDIVHSWSEYDEGQRISDHGTWEVYWRIDRWHLRSPEYGEWDNGDYYQGDEVYWNAEIGSSKMEVIGNVWENPELLD